MILSDCEIRDLCMNKDKPLLNPFSEAVSGGGVISYGLTSAGYDLRLGPEVEVFNGSSGEVVDPKKFGDSLYRRKMFVTLLGLKDGERVVIPINGYILARSVEYIRMPRGLKGQCVGKSTYARSGILVNTTPLEPGWEGHLTIEISNVCPCPAVVYVGEGVAQLEFFRLSNIPEVDYAEKGGKYQGQVGVTPARVT